MCDDERCDLCDDCKRCQRAICPEREPLRFIAGKIYCDTCAEAIIRKHKGRIKKYVSKLKITRRPMEYDPDKRFTPAPEEFEAGNREAHTENSVAAYNRHECTNYDELVKPLDRDDALDQAIYDELRKRVDELISDYELLCDDGEEEDSN